MVETRASAALSNGPPSGGPRETMRKQQAYL